MIDLWSKKHKKPYHKLALSLQTKCIRCGTGKAIAQWQVCSDGGNYRPICGRCDIALNALVLEFMHHPDAERLMEKYING